MADEADIDRIWILRKIHKNMLYYRDLAYFAPALYQGLVDATGVDGNITSDSSWQGSYDYTQNIYRGYCRKECAVLGTRIPNAIAVPNDPSDQKDIQASRAANNAALYIREQCDMQVLTLWLVFSLFNFGTSFWTIEWVDDGDKYGWKDVPQLAEEQASIGGGQSLLHNAARPVMAIRAPSAAAAWTADHISPAPMSAYRRICRRSGCRRGILRSIFSTPAR